MPAALASIIWVGYVYIYIFAICTEYISIVLKLLFVFGSDTENLVYSGSGDNN